MSYIQLKIRKEKRMTMISFEADEGLEKKINESMNNEGFKNRSEFIRVKLTRCLGAFSQTV